VTKIGGPAKMALPAGEWPSFDPCKHA